MKALSVIFLLAALRTGTAYGQTPQCTGGQGDPIVDVTFGSGPKFGPPLPAGTTSMLQYATQQCPPDGYYAIVNYTTGCWCTQGDVCWHTATDHTGDPNGYFMLINASYAPSDFYIQTLTGLCQGTTYQFAAWIVNMCSNPGIPPNLTFDIELADGTVLNTYSTGDIPITNPMAWMQYGMYFTVPPGVSTVVLRMRNNAPGGRGNDIGLDDITFRPVGPVTTIGFTNYSGDSVAVCEGANGGVQLSSAVQNCYVNTVYQWQLSSDLGADWTDIIGATAAQLSAATAFPGTNMYRLTVAQLGNIGSPGCRIASPPDILVVLPKPNSAIHIEATADQICIGSDVTFTTVTTDPGLSPNYQWYLNGTVVGRQTTYSSSTLANGDTINCVLNTGLSCGVAVTSNTITMQVNPVVKAALAITASSDTICSGSSVSFSAIPINGGSNPQYQWQVNGAYLGSTGPTFTSSTLQNGDQVNCTLTSSLDCTSPVSSSSPVFMIVYPLPSIALPADTVIASGSSVQLHPEITGSISTYLWSPSNGLNNPGIADPVASPISTTTYELTGVSLEGCTASGKEVVSVFYNLVMPNAFTPAEAGHNALFRIPASEPVSLIDLSVYNRWGQLLVTTNDSQSGWDGRFNGKPQPAGAYVWVIVYRDLLTGQPLEKKGIVLLIR